MPDEVDVYLKSIQVSNKELRVTYQHPRASLRAQVSNKELRVDHIHDTVTFAPHKYPTRNWEVMDSVAYARALCVPSIQQGIERIPNQLNYPLLIRQVSNKELRVKLQCYLPVIVRASIQQGIERPSGLLGRRRKSLQVSNKELRGNVGVDNAAALVKYPTRNWERCILVGYGLGGISSIQQGIESSYTEVGLSSVIIVKYPTRNWERSSSTTS